MPDDVELYVCLEAGKLRYFDPKQEAYLLTSKEKSQVIQEQDLTIQEKDLTIEEKDDEIRKLQARLAKLESLQAGDGEATSN